MQTIDLTPKFLDFYETAMREGADAERRWALWQEKYGFAAVPPTPEGQAQARQLLEQAWPRYPEVLDRIRQGAAGMQPQPAEMIGHVAELFSSPVPDNLFVVAFVGALENNAFTAPQGDKFGVFLPVEQDPASRALMLPHELAHAMHYSLAGFTNAWDRPLAQLVLEEGIAQCAAMRVVPGHPREAYLEYRSGWLAACEAKHREILAGMLPLLGDDRSETVYRFTMGNGTTGLEREAYYAGWIAVSHLLDEGWTLRRLASLQADEIEPVIRGAMQQLLAATNNVQGG